MILLLNCILLSIGGAGIAFHFEKFAIICKYLSLFMIEANLT